jgi:tripartite-type tricarboxylate transporter receptor subunit TctC
MALASHKRGSALMKLAAVLGFCALMLAGGGQSRGQDAYPSRPIRLVVGFPPGTATDLVVRQIAEGIKKNTGWVIYVDNRVGQAGSIAARELARLTPDGYTLLVTANGPLITNPNLYSNIEYDTLRDFTPIGQVATLPYVMVVNSSKPYNSVQDIVDAAKKAPGKLNYSSTGLGTTSHLIGSMFSNRTGSVVTHIPYKGSSESITGILEGSIDFTFDTSVSTTPLVQGGQLRALAVASKQRLPALPDVPTLGEVGAPVNMNAWLGIVAPRGMPDDLVQRLGRELEKVVASPDQKERLAQVGAVAEWTSPAEFTRFLQAEVANGQVMVRESGAKLQ